MSKRERRASPRRNTTSPSLVVTRRLWDVHMKGRTGTVRASSELGRKIWAQARYFSATVIKQAVTVTGADVTARRAHSLGEEACCGQDPGARCTFRKAAQAHTEQTHYKARGQNSLRASAATPLSSRSLDSGVPEGKDECC
ncbi:hypothetical protein P7K49_032488 [Saguinus oedipus]|uniref:Uncharacterized protein n=1 Tax=Saguinus oedipus TaxID=9490 RepID=A0ABQ9TYD4_SAGOE|nr:hypothetical protein P7K49_032488 [Saguinus oedipus]